MLTRDNVTLLGGEVDSLVEENTPTNTLANLLQSNEALKDDHPPCPRSRFTPKTIEASSERTTKQKSNSFNVQAKRAKTDIPAVTLDDNDDDDDALLLAADAIKSPPPTVRSNPTSTSNIDWDDDFDDDDVLMSQIPIPSEVPTSRKPTGQQKTAPKSKSKPWLVDCDDEDYMLDLEDEIRREMRNNHQEESTQAFIPDEEPLRKLDVPLATENQPVRSLNMQQQEQNKKAVELKREKVSQPLPKEAKVLQSKMDSFFSPYKISSVSASSSSSFSSSSSYTSSSSTFSSKPHTVNVDRSVPDITIKQEIKTEKEEEQTVKKEMDLLPLTAPPFTYLSRIIAKMSAHHQTSDAGAEVFHVKAFVSSIQSKLSSNQGRAWTLRVMVNDGTLAIEADLADEMLASIIGYTALECEEMRVKMKTNRELGQKLQKGMRACQGILIEMCGIFTLQMRRAGGGANSPPARPVILAYREVTREDVRLLEQRNKLQT